MFDLLKDLQKMGGPGGAGKGPGLGEAMKQAKVCTGSVKHIMHDANHHPLDPHFIASTFTHCVRNTRKCKQE